MAWTDGRRGWFPLAVTLLVLVACSGGAENEELPPGVVEGSAPVAPPVATSAAPSPTTTTAAGCSNETAVASDPGLRVGTAREADVDGDGDLDTVALASDPAGPAGCSWFVVADIGDSVVAEPVWEVGPESGLPQPQLRGLLDIDGQPGSEILVDEAAGASTQFVGAFVFVEGDLERVTAEGGIAEGTGSFDDLFPFGGSVGHIEAVDCVGEQVVVSTATPSSDQDEMAEGIYEVERRFYEFDGATLERIDTERVDAPVDQLDRFPEFGTSPFVSC